jgi:hypothetical protein
MVELAVVFNNSGFGFHSGLKGMEWLSKGYEAVSWR